VKNLPRSSALAALLLAAAGAATPPPIPANVSPAVRARLEASRRAAAERRAAATQAAAQQVADQTPAAPGASDWAMKPDPPATGTTAPAAPPFKAYSSDLGEGELLWGDPRERFVLVRRFMGWALWDTATGTLVRDVKAGLPFREPALSPDGSLMAGATAKGVEIWSLKSGARVATVAAPGSGPDASPENRAAAPATPPSPGRGAGRGFPLQPAAAPGRRDGTVAGFVTNKVLASVFGRGMGKPADVVLSDTASGKQIRTFSVSDTPRKIIFSPGGNFAIVCLGVASRFRVDLYNVQTGNKIGELPAETASTAAFSPDGRMFALYANFMDGVHLTLYETASGKTLASSKLPGMARVNADVVSMQFRPDNGALLLQNVVYDVNGLKELYAGAVDPQDVLRSRWIDADHLMVATNAAGKLTMDTLVADRASLARAAAAIAAGGTADDAALAPLTPLAPGKVTFLTLAPVTAPWTPIAPVPTTAKKITSAPLVLKTTGTGASLPGCNPERVLGYFLTSIPTHAIFVERAALAIEQPQFANELLLRPFKRGSTGVDRFDLATGANTASVEAGPLRAMLDASPSGKQIAFVAGNDHTHLEIWQEADKTFKPLIAFRPFGMPPPKPPVGSMFSTNVESLPNGVEWAAFVDETHVLVHDTGHDLGLIDIAAHRFVWRGPAQVFFNWRDPRIPVLSPDRRTLAVSNAHDLYLVDSLSGKLLNSLHFEGPVSPHFVMFSADNARLIAFSADTGVQNLHVFDLATGKRQMLVPISNDAVGLGWARPMFTSPDAILLPNGDLFSLDARAMIAHYDLELDQKIPGQGFEDYRIGNVQPYDRLFYPFATPVSTPATPGSHIDRTPPRNHFLIRPPMSWVLCNIVLPDPAAIKTFQDREKANGFIIHPGTHIHLVLDTVGGPAFQESQLKEWTSRLQELGFVLDDHAEAELHVHNFVISNSQTYKDWNNESVSLTHYTPGYDITLTLRGDSVWHIDDKDYKPTAPLATLDRKPGESAQSAADRHSHPPTEMSTIITPPRYIANSRPPSAKLTKEGIPPGGH
jgi:hypothetical protein